MYLIIKFVYLIAFLCVCRAGIVDLGLFQTNVACSAEIETSKGVGLSLGNNILNILLQYASIPPGQQFTTLPYVHAALCRSKVAGDDVYIVGSVQSNSPYGQANIPCNPGAGDDLISGTVATQPSKYKQIAIGSLYLTINPPSGDIYTITLVTQITPNDDSQAWYFNPDGHIESKKYPGVVLDAKNGQAVRTEVIGYAQKNPSSPNQLWTPSGSIITSQLAAGLNIVPDQVTNTNGAYVDFVNIPPPISLPGEPITEVSQLASLAGPLIYLGVNQNLAQNPTVVNKAAQSLSLPTLKRTTSLVATTIASLAGCGKTSYPQIPTDIIDQFVNANKPASVSVCELPDLDEPSALSFVALSLLGKNVGNSCPEGALWTVTVPVLFNNQPAVYNVYDARSVSTYANSDTLAIVSDPDGAIVSATTTSTLPAGVGLNSATGSFYVTNKNNLQAGTYTLSVTVTDTVGGSTTLTVVIKILAQVNCGLLQAPCGGVCYNTLLQVCASSGGRLRICLIGDLICINLNL